MENRSLKDWCISLDENSKKIEEYEQTLKKLYKNLYKKQSFDSPYVTKCYTKEKFTFSMLFKVIAKHLKTFSTLFGMFLVLSFLTLWIRQIIITKTLKGTGVTALISLIIAVAIVVVAIVGVLLVKKIKHDKYCRILSNIETNLASFMETVPSFYRASDKMRIIATIYHNFPTVESWKVLPSVDELLQTHGRTSDYMAVMYDLPCNCPYLQTSEKQIEEIVVETPKNENLPSDIETKVFEGAKDAQKELSEMICLEEVKKQIEKFKNRIQFYGQSANGCHMGFFGGAGVGKTTVARIITKILYDLGYIKKNQYIEISGDYLSSGSTSRALAIIEYSYGGVLFIDEAYLMQKNGAEVIGVLLKAMEDHRNDFVVILAGYEEQMNKLFASNAGFTSRVKHILYFKDYTESELLQIFNYFIKDYNGKAYTLSQDAIPDLLNIFTFEKRSQNFGNARTVRNAVDEIMDNYADRSIKEHTDTQIISVEDVQTYANDRMKVLQNEFRNISAVNQLDESIVRLAELKPKMKQGSDNPMEDLNKLIGVDTIKKEVELLKRIQSFYDEIIHQKILLVGGDGCGKATVARILTGALYQYGYIQNNQYLEITADFLKGSYLGHTTKRAEAIISYASGGVLYIKGYTALASSNDEFASEAQAVILNAIKDNKDVTIILGDKPSEYIDNIKNLFTIVYEFPVYSKDQKFCIFDSFIKQDKFIFSQEALTQIYNSITDITTIRDLQQLYTTIIKNHISNYDETSTEDKFLITTNDL